MCKIDTELSADLNLTSIKLSPNQLSRLLTTKAFTNQANQIRRENHFNSRHKMTSDVVRWSKLCSQQNQMHQPRDVMTARNKLHIARRRNRNTSQNEDFEYDASAATATVAGASTAAVAAAAATINAHFNKIVVLFIWLVINQNVSLVLSDRILATSNLTIGVKSQTSDGQLIHSPNDDPLAAHSMSLHGVEAPSSNDIDLPSQYRSHHAIGDDDIHNDKHFTSTWAVHIPGGDDVADYVAREHGFTNLGKVCSQFLT